MHKRDRFGLIRVDRYALFTQSVRKNVCSWHCMLRSPAARTRNCNRTSSSMQRDSMTLSTRDTELTEDKSLRNDCGEGEKSLKIWLVKVARMRLLQRYWCIGQFVTRRCRIYFSRPTGQLLWTNAY